MAADPLAVTGLPAEAEVEVEVEDPAPPEAVAAVTPLATAGAAACVDPPRWFEPGLDAAAGAPPAEPGVAGPGPVAERAPPTVPAAGPPAAVPAGVDPRPAGDPVAVRAVETAFDPAAPRPEGAATPSPPEAPAARAAGLLAAG